VETAVTAAALTVQSRSRFSSDYNGRERHGPYRGPLVNSTAVAVTGTGGSPINAAPAMKRNTNVISVQCSLVLPFSFHVLNGYGDVCDNALSCGVVVGEARGPEAVSVCACLPVARSRVDHAACPSPLLYDPFRSDTAGFQVSGLPSHHSDRLQWISTQNSNAALM
jgi:hypothetical protein